MLEVIKILNLKAILREIILTLALVLSIALMLASLPLLIKVIITLNIGK
jgi:hypothetical protein